MAERPPICSICKRNEVRAGGFYLNVNRQFKLNRIDLALAGQQYDDEKFTTHICGKECLTKYINAQVDLMFAAVSLGKRSVA